MAHSLDVTDLPGFLAGGGETGALIGAKPWARTPLGPLELWPQSLRTATAILLRSPVPMVMLWGEEGVMLYNDAYSAFAGGRHPALLGSRVREGWPEVAAFNDRVMRVGLAGGTLSFKDQELTLFRHGRPEQVFMNLDYSPVLGEDGRPAGVLAIVVETTERVLAERRQAFRLRLKERLRDIPDPRAVMDAAVEELGRHLGANRVGYSEVLPDDATILLQSCYADGVEPLLGAFGLDSFGPNSVARQRKGTTEVCRDVRADAGQVQDTWAAIDTRAFVSVPLIRNTRFTASLYVNFREPHDWAPEEVELIEDVAARTWEAVERARAEEALRRSEERLRALVTASSDVIYRMSPDWTEMRQLDGRGFLADTAAPDRDWLERYIHPDDQAHVLAKIREAVRTTSVFELEHRVRRADGTLGWTSSKAVPVLDGDGQVAEWFGAATDVTARREAEERLRESEERLRLAADAARIGTWDFDLRTGTGRWDQATLRIAGLPFDEPTYDAGSWLRIVHPDDRERAGAAFAASLTPDGPHYDIEFRCAQPAEDGGPRWLTSHGAVLRDPDTRGALRAVGIVRDVTSRRRREERLAESEAQLRLGLSAGRMVAWTLDLDSRTILRSENADEIFGPGSTPEAFNARMLPEDVTADQARLRAVIEGAAERYVSEFRYRHPDGRLLWLQNWGHAVRDAEGRPLRLHGVCIDNTERKSAEQALASSEERLRLAQEAGEIGLWDWDLRSGEVVWSEGYYRIWGIDPAEPPAFEGFLARIDPEQREQVRQGLEDARAGLTPWSAEMRVPGRDGTARWIAARGEFRRGAEGRPERMIGVCFDITAQKVAEEHARERERQFRTLADTVPSIVWFAAPSGELHFLNKRWYDFTGQTPEEALPHGWAATLHPDDAERTAAEWADARARVVTYEVEIRYRRRDGAYRWYVARAEPLRDPDGTVTAWFGTSTDIHDRKMAESALRELNETLEQRVEERTQERDRIWRQSHDLMCVARIDGTLLSVNPAWERLLGWPLDWLTGRNAAEIKHPEDAERTAAELRNLAEGHPTFGFEDRYRHKDGSWRWISWTIQPEAELIYCVGRDVTAEKEARAALEIAEAARREADALYRAYFRNTPEALFVIRVEPDGGFVIEEVNPAHEAGVGFRLEEIRGRRIDEVLPPDLADRIAATYRHVVRTGEIHQYREEFELGGIPKHWDTSLVPVRNDDGRVVRLIGSSRDVTRQVLAEEALRQSQKMEAVGQLTGGIAHDFNNLLGAVVGSLDLIRRKPADAEKVRRFAEAGLEAAERGTRLTGQLLAFSRAQRLELRPVAAPALVEGMRDLLSRTLGPMVRLTLRCDGGAVLTDPTQLEMAILNLAINARDAMHEGGDLTISVNDREVRDDAELAPGPYVELSVADTGSGMPAEVAERAFDPFFTTKGVGKGTGLGLSQVYGMARQAGGTARIESRPGAGTTVRIFLPRTSQEQPGAEPQAADTTAAPGGTTILVVDDDADVRRMLVASLDSLGHVVVEAEDGGSGLAALDAQEFDLMVVDFAMPGMNGAEVARAARERRPGLPVVIASGYADTAAIEDAIGKDALVLRKPFRVSDLQAVLEDALGSRPARSARRP